MFIVLNKSVKAVYLVLTFFVGSFSSPEIINLKYPLMSNFLNIVYS